MLLPPQDTVERWAFEYIASTDLKTKLAPPPLPTLWAETMAPLRIETPGRPPELVTRVGRMKSVRPGALLSPLRRADILHRFWHHELQAAELLVWAVLAFPETPLAFRRGLMAIAQDEIRHMVLYREQLERLGFGVGGFPVNDWFWKRVPSATSPVHFVSIMGMGLEAGNLDHGVRFAESFKRAGDEEAAQVQDRVVREEVAHVAFGIRWFETFRGAINFDDWRSFLPEPLSPAMMRGEPLNLSARSRAGFPDPFLDRLGQWKFQQ